jgi:hypothetical protein
MYFKNHKIRIMPLILILLIISSTLLSERNKVFAESIGTTDFVTRLYNLCQSRQPDTGGLSYWVNQLESGSVTGAGVVESFVYSPEFVGKNLSDDKYLSIMYKAMFNREPDVGGLTYWMNKLSSGATRRYALANFVNSNEFSGVCSSYGITRGCIGLNSNVDIYHGVTAFVQRFYLKCQERMPDQDGLIYWVNTLVSKSSTAADLAVGFTNSSEFILKNLSNADYVSILYRTFYDREPDSGGQAYWVKILENGNSRRFVLAGFVSSPEFKDLCNSYGITSGSIGTDNNDLPFSESNLQSYLNSNYSALNTDLGTTAFKIEVCKNTSRISGDDYWIRVRYDSTFFYNLHYSNTVTSQQRECVKQQLKDFQEKLAKDVINKLPSKKFFGGYYDSWYRYPYIQVDLITRYYYSWTNYDDAPLGTIYDYDVTTPSTFRWYPLIDDEL